MAARQAAGRRAVTGARRAALPVGGRKKGRREGPLIGPCQNGRHGERGAMACARRGQQRQTGRPGRRRGRTRRGGGEKGRRSRHSGRCGPTRRGHLVSGPALTGEGAVTTMIPMTGLLGRSPPV